MKTLLRNVATGLYFQGPDRWTTNPSEALDFRMIDRALKLIQSLRLEGVELAFTFRDQEAVHGVAVDKIAVYEQ